MALFIIKSDCKSYQAKLKLTCDSPNVLMPKSELYVASNDGITKQMFFIAQKVDPTKEWGQFNVEILGAKKTEQNRSVNQSYLLPYMTEAEIRQKQEAERMEMEGLGGGGRGRRGGQFHI